MCELLRLRGLERGLNTIEDYIMTKEELTHREHEIKHKLSVIILFGHMANGMKKGKTVKGALAKAEAE